MSATAVAALRCTRTTSTPEPEPEPEPFSPLDIEGLVLWLDADEAASFTLSGDEVDVWADLSPAGNSFDSSVDNAPPIRELAGLNGRAVVRFDGNTRLRSDSAPGGTMEIPSPQTVLFVAETDTDGAWQAIIHDGQSGADEWWIGRKGDTDTLVYVAGELSGASWSGAAISSGVPFYSTVVFDGASSVLRIDGVEEIADNAGTGTMGPSVITLGRFSTGSGWQGIIPAILVYDRALLAAEIDELEAYLAERWIP